MIGSSSIVARSRSHPPSGASEPAGGEPVFLAAKRDGEALRSRSDEYYREAFDLFAYNYLLKPVTEETLEYVMKPLKKLLCNGNDDRVIHFQYRARVYTVRYSQVSYITSSLHIVNFHKTDGSILQCRGKLKDFEKQLDDSTFLRCHQSFIVNMERVTGAENDSFHIGEHVIPISRSYNRNAHEKYDELSEASAGI